jgi:hypothetical protein
MAKVWFGVAKHKSLLKITVAGGVVLLSILYSK